MLKKLCDTFGRPRLNSADEKFILPFFSLSFRQLRTRCRRNESVSLEDWRNWSEANQTRLLGRSSTGNFTTQRWGKSENVKSRRLRLDFNSTRKTLFIQFVERFCRSVVIQQQFAAAVGGGKEDEFPRFDTLILCNVLTMQCIHSLARCGLFG